jgi:hypothetical protein
VSPLTEALDGLRPMPLAEVDARAALLSRTCRKYLVPADLLPTLFAGAGERCGVLTIDGHRVFRYSSTYLDTPDLRTFHDHRRGRRLRFKTRVRAYVDTGTRVFEVKLEGARGVTDKIRMAYDGPADRLTWRTRTFIDDVVGAYGMDPPDTLSASAVTDYRRSTVVALSGGERVTVDTGLIGYRDGRCVRMRPDLALLEVKTRGGLTPTERRLHEYGHRTVGFSKYGAVVAALDPRLAGHRWHRAMRSCLGPPAEVGPEEGPWA